MSFEPQDCSSMISMASYGSYLSQIWVKRQYEQVKSSKVLWLVTTMLLGLYFSMEDAHAMIEVHVFLLSNNRINAKLATAETKNKSRHFPPSLSQRVASRWMTWFSTALSTESSSKAKLSATWWNIAKDMHHNLLKDPRLQCTVNSVSYLTDHQTNPGEANMPWMFMSFV